MGETGLLVHLKVNGRGSGSEGQECTLVFGGFEPECKEREMGLQPEESIRVKKRCQEEGSWERN